MTASPGSAKRIAVIVAAVLVLQAGAFAAYRVIGERKQASRSPVPLAYERVQPESRGAKAPLKTPDGAVVTLDHFRGKPVLVHFWATFCAPCRTELPELLELANDSKLTLLLVSVDADWSVVRHFFDGDIPRHLVLDESGDARRAFSVSTLPDTYLLDAAGRTVLRFHGPREWLRGRQQLNALVSDATDVP